MQDGLLIVPVVVLIVNTLLNPEKNKQSYLFN
jgi:hypothetical protein